MEGLVIGASPSFRGHTVKISFGSWSVHQWCVRMAGSFHLRRDVLVVSAGSLYPVSCSVAWILIELTTFSILFIALFTFFVTFDDFRVSIELAVGLYSLSLGLITN